MSVHRSLALLLLASVSSIAQTPAEAPPGVPVPGVVPRPAGAPAVNPLKPAANLGDTKIVEDILEEKLNGDTLAGLYRRYTGRRVIVTTAASAAEFKFIQEASPTDPLTFAEAAELLRKAAVLEGFVFTQHPDDPNLDILTVATGGTSNRGVNIDVFNETSVLPNTDIVITYVMTLNYIKPDQAVQIFTQVIGQFGAYGSITSVPNASAVVITEKASLIKSLIELQKTIDVPGSVQATRFIKVQYADVTEIAAVLTELLTAQASAQNTASVQRAPVQGAPPGVTLPGQPGGSTAGEDTPVQIVPEPRTNRIFAMGRPVDLIFVENLVREFDIPTSEKTFMRRKLRFLTVSEFLPIAGEALTRAFGGTGEGGAGGGSSAGGGASRSQSSARPVSSGSSRSSRSSSSSLGGSSSFGGSSSGFGGSSSGLGGSSSGLGGGGGGSSFSNSSVSSAPESLLVGRTLLVADNITNSIVAQGPPSALEIIERLLDQIDVKPDQVMISTVIGQLTLNKSNEFGMNYLVNGSDVLAGGGGSGFPALLPAATSASTFPEFDNSTLTGSGLRVFGRIGDLSVFLKALQSKTDFTVLSRPSIFTSNNQPGLISSGEKIAIPTEGGTTSGSYSSGTRIQYQDVVLKLEVTPLVNSDNEITMQISLLSDEQNGNQVIQGAGTNGGDLTVPKISTREIITTATVPNNETIVLGGLIVSRDSQEKSGIPILSDIPYLGRLFSTTTDKTDRTELMVFIQPSVVSNDRSLTAVQNDMDSRYRVSPRAHDFADGDSVLPGVSEIPRVEETGKGGSPRTAAPKATPVDESGNSMLKPSIRPIHRR